MMINQVSIKVEKGAGKNPYPTTNEAWRRRLVTETYPQTIKF